MDRKVYGITGGEWRDDWLDNEHGWVLSYPEDGSGGVYLAEAVTSDEAGSNEESQKRQAANLALMAAAPSLLLFLDKHRRGRLTDEEHERETTMLNYLKGLGVRVGNR